MKVKFILTGSPADKIYISPAYLMLKAYYNLKGKNKDQVFWTDTIYDPNISVDEMFELIKTENIDILCLSMYIWNRAQLTHLSQLVKTHLPNVIIIAGGPDLDAHCNPTFFANNTTIDYVVYGDGEQAFCQILDSIIENAPLLDANNIVTPDKIWPHKIFQDKEFSELSPWLELRDELIATVNRYGKNNTVIYWEMARGCPYSCSFCDWNNGLHNKVKRRRSNWKDEIDFFVEIGVEVRVIDANWGMYKEDVEIHKYAIQRLKFVAMNLPKLNKQVAYEIMALSYEHFPEGRYCVSLQDLNEDVLKNIDRPSPPWNEHKALLIDLQAKHPKLILKGELIIGLPGQTIDSWIDTLIELESAGIRVIEENIWMMLPGSPAYKPEYQKKFSIKYDELIFVNNQFNSLHEINDAINVGLPGWYKTRIVTGTMSANFADILTIYSLSELYNAFNALFKKVKFADIVHRIRPKVEQECIGFAKQISETKLFVVEENNRVVSLRDYYYDIKKIKRLL